MSKGRTERGCPLCHDMTEDENAIPLHIRESCRVAAMHRVWDMGLAPKGFDGAPENKTQAASEAVGRDPETGNFVSRGETA